MSRLPSMPVARYDPWRGESGLYDPRWSPVDKAIRAFLRAGAALDGTATSNLRKALGADDVATLLLFARRSSVFGMRAHGPKQSTMA